MTVFANSSDSSGSTQVLHFQGADQIVEFKPAVVALAVDKESGRAIDSAPDAAQEVGTDARRVGSSGKSDAKLVNRQRQLSGQGHVQLVAEVLLVLVEAVVHLRKAHVAARDFGDL